MKKSWYRHIPVVFGNHRYCVSVSVRVRSSMAPYDWSVNKQHCETFNIPSPYVPPVEYEWQYVYRPPSYNMNCSFNFFGELGDAWMVYMPEPFFGF